MMDLLKFLDARMGEPSTWAGLATALALLHVNLDPGLLHQASLWGGVLSAVLAAVLSEIGQKPGAQIAGDALAAFVAAVKAMPDSTKTAMLGLCVVTALAACSDTQNAQVQKAMVQFQKGALVACQVDGQAQPVIVAMGTPIVTAVVPAAAPTINGFVALDQAAVHPAVQAACAGLGKAVAVSAPPVS